MKTIKRLDLGCSATDLWLKGNLYRAKRDAYFFHPEGVYNLSQDKIVNPHKFIPKPEVLNPRDLTANEAQVYCALEAEKLYWELKKYSGVFPIKKVSR